MKNYYFLLLLGILAQCQSPTKPTEMSAKTENIDLILQNLGTAVDSAENREFSYTNKTAAFYYARTHSQINQDWFSGWNVQTERIFRDYVLLIDGEKTDRKTAQTTVFPHFFERKYKENLSEKLYLYDEKNVIGLEIDGKTEKIALALLGERIKFAEFLDEIVYYQLPELPKYWVGIVPRKPEKIEKIQKDSLVFAQTSAENEGFFIGLATNKDELKKLLQEAQTSHKTWQANRTERMKKLISEQSYFYSSDQNLTQAIRWNTLTLDQLITRQTGYGIYAGLPWFTDYWGRDLFISLEGASLVTGQFEIAEQILADFARYQNQDSTSKEFGRVPNRLRPNDIIYNTTDGTPRFVLACQTLNQYTGKQKLEPALEKAVINATEGALKNWTDPRGYLKHEDADTWMDAKIEGKIPWSPRGLVANDIQALWYGQLNALLSFKQNPAIQALSLRTKPISEKLAQNFQNDFWLDSLGYMADRIMPNGKPDPSFRPNQLFALDFLKNRDQQEKVVRKVWERLTYPWGVASLWQEHPEFHPYHENPESYHKDAAYHNGTVWVWNNGIMMEKMLAFGQKESAYELFENMGDMTLRQGAVGSLPENTDAHLLPNAQKIRFTGTFLQAWSGAEYLRVWYKYFLGIQPQDDFLAIKPKIPTKIKDFRSRQRYQKGFIKTEFFENRLNYTFEQIETLLEFQYLPFEKVGFEIKPNDQLIVEIGENSLEIWHKDATGKTKNTQKLSAKPENQIENWNLKFATPKNGNWQALREKNFLDTKRRAEWKARK